MADQIKHVFSNHRGVVEVLIKHFGLHEGIWRLYVEFGLGATNVKGPSGELVPAALIGLAKIGLNKVDKEDDLSVDASKVNPRGRSKTEQQRGRSIQPPPSEEPKPSRIVLFDEEEK